MKLVKIFHNIGIDKKNEIIKEIRIMRQDFGPKDKDKYQNMLKDSVLINMLTRLQQHFNVSTETNDSISNATIEEAGPLFIWMVKYPNLYWIAWKEFLNDLFNNSSLRKILMILFKIRNIAYHKDKAIDSKHFFTYLSILVREKGRCKYILSFCPL